VIDGAMIVFSVGAHPTSGYRFVAITWTFGISA